jgi:hypothetical protein
LEVYDILLAVVNVRKGYFSEYTRDLSRSALVEYTKFYSKIVPNQIENR